GLNYKDYPETIDRVTRKFARQRDYAKRFLSNFDQHHFMFWSPVVPRGILSTALLDIEGLEVVMNEDYASRVAELQKHVMTAKQDLGNPFLRALQILSCLRKPCN